SLRVLPLLLLIWLAAPLQADDGDYFLELSVADEQQSTQDAAFAEGLRRLLLRLGNGQPLWLRPAFADLPPAAWRYVAKFNYRSPADNSQRRILRIWFRPDALRTALAQRGLALNRETTETLVWLLRQQGEEYRLVDPDEPASAYRSLTEQGRAQGLRLLLPLADLQERAAFAADQGQAQADASLISLSQRYAVGALLIGRLSPLEGGWRLHWTRLEQGQRSEWADQGPQLGPLLGQGLARLSAAPQATPTDQGETLELAIGGLDSPGSARRLLDYLNRLSLVQAARHLGREGAWQILQLDLIGGRDDLLQALAFGGQLAAVAPPQPAKPKPKPPAHDFQDPFNLPGRSQAPKPGPAQPKRLYFTRL
ncbi:MAG: DUF2066 domain-containing protein, partial [Gammaproteobacteria bacterium SHHR-1]